MAARSAAGAAGAAEAVDPAVEGGTTAPRAGEVALVEVEVEEEEDMEVEGREVSEAEAAGPTAPAARRRMAAGAADMVEADLTPGGKSSTHLARFSPWLPSPCLCSSSHLRMPRFALDRLSTEQKPHKTPKKYSPTHILTDTYSRLGIRPRP